MLVLAAVGLWLVFELLHHPKAGLVLGFLILLAAICSVTGLITLPFGVVRTVRRRLHPLVLTCPKCGLESHTSQRPFEITRWSHLD